jgi:hypothetical protein
MERIFNRPAIWETRNDFLFKQKNIPTGYE